MDQYDNLYNHFDIFTNILFPFMQLLFPCIDIRIENGILLGLRIYDQYRFCLVLCTHKIILAV